ncbi:HNH endonuclease [uncultured Aquimarina sp.]|uniref:HNH endonuclease n=1 Tax=uncultured Aquimarina sp. TaxID=575652 RepID=UPI002633DE78|nr:HNH endonuclease [uncultured Aquimarina sp.]
MYSYQIKFIALEDTIGFELKSPNENEVEEFVYDIISIFATVDENDRPLIISLQNNSLENKVEISNFVSKYCEKLPQLNALKAFFNKLKDDDSFFFLPNIKMELAESTKLRDYLRALKEGLDFEELNSQTTELFGDLMDNYTLGGVGDKRVEIGEKNKLHRTCRFCDRKSDLTTFDSKAHAISEALGNKTIVLYEECDECNKRFSETIESDIVQYLSLFRTIYDVKGKNRGKGKGGSKKFKGKNFDLKNNGNVELSFQSEDDRPIKNDEDYNIKLEAEQPIISQNIYKALCKYYLSIIDKKHLKHFKKTIDWINGKIEIDRLPKIAEMTSYHSFAMQPKLTYFLRKTEDKEIPFAIGEFYFTCKIFAFIIPLCSQDDKNFLEEIEYKNFWKTFRHFDKTKGWVFNDFSNNNKRDFTINLNFELKGKKASK